MFNQDSGTFEPKLNINNKTTYNVFTLKPNSDYNSAKGECQQNNMEIANVKTSDINSTIAEDGSHCSNIWIGGKYNQDYKTW